MTQAVSVAQGGSFNQTMRNRIINGNMVIDQRNAGGSVATTTTGNAVFTIDRWAYIVSQASKFTVQQNAGSVTPPVGFTNYLGVTSTSAYSVTSTDYFGVYQPIEGFNTADLGWGTANAASVTVSFWVRSSLTGTFGASVRNGDFNRSYPFSYTINSANTWEQKTVTIAGDTTGTWATTNTKSTVLLFGLGMGSTYSNTSGAWIAGDYSGATGATSVVGTSGATFYITGVQLEAGSAATPFEYRPYGMELALCQRYFRSMQRQAGNSGTVFAIGTCYGDANIYISSGGAHPVEMRSTPTLSLISTFRVEDAVSTSWVVSAIVVGSTTSTVFSPTIQLTTNGTAGRVVYLQATNDASRIQLSAEL